MRRRKLSSSTEVRYKPADGNNRPRSMPSRSISLSLSCGSVAKVTMFIDRRAVVFDTKRRFVGLAMMALTFEEKKQLAVRDLVDFRRAGAKRLLEITLPQIIGLSNMAIDIDHTYCLF